MGNQKTSTAIEKFEIIQPYLEEDIPLSQIAKISSKGLSTLKRWVNNYKTHGLEGLERQGRSDKGARNLITKELEELVEALILEKPPVSLAAIHRKVVKVAKKKGSIQPTYRVVWDIAKKINPSIVLLAHDGVKAYNQKYELIYRREASGPNEIWQADHTPLDIVLVTEKGDSQKPWLTSIIDDYSRVICGYYLSFEAPCSINTALALHQAIWRKRDPKWQICGIPGIFYTDNGSDFKSDHIKQVAADLKIQLKNSIPGKPQGRGKIERFFSTVNQLLLMNLPGYCPPQYPYPKAKLTMEEFIPLFERFIIDEYHQRNHSSINTSPINRWIDKGFLPQLPESLKQLDLLLLTVVKSRKVHRDGIHFQNLTYIESTLASYVNEDVMIRYDPRDLTEIRVYHDDIFLCRAVCQELAGESVSLKEIIKARQQRKSDLKKVISERKSLVDALLGTPVTKLKQVNKPLTKKHKLKLYNND